MLASSDNLARNNRALIVMAVAWAKKQNLLYSDGCCLGKKTEFIRSECEMVSRKVE